MANIVEDGSGLINANAYIDVAFADGYFADRLDLSWVGTVAEKEAFILKATDYIELIFRTQFKGIKFLETQALSFPRLAIDGVTAEPIPINLKKACAEYSKIACTNTLLPNPVTPTDDGLAVTELTKEVAGAVKKTVKYDPNQPIILIKNYPLADYLLADLLKSRFGKVIRN